MHIIVSTRALDLAGSIHTSFGDLPCSRGECQSDVAVQLGMRASRHSWMEHAMPDDQLLLISQ